MFNFTGVQHLKTGDVVIPIAGYEKKDQYLARYHQEMAYAIGNEDFIGLTVIVFDNAGSIVMHENWVREVEVVPEPEALIVEPEEEPIEGE